MKKLGLVGQNISYSLSPYIHNYLFEKTNIQGQYDLIDIDDINLLTNETLNNYDGLNITVPYKQKIVKLIDYIDPNIKYLKTINTINKENGKLIGYNTDILGFDYFYTKYIEKCKTIGILGNSATANIIKYYFKTKNKNIYIFSSKENTNENIYLYKNIKDFNIDFLINTTPLGQGEYYNKSIMSFSQLKPLKLKYVLDFNYSPYQTKLLKDCKKLGFKTFNGLSILVYQAVKSFEIFNNLKLPNNINEQIIQKVSLKSTNGIIIYGMPLSGKTTMFNEISKNNDLNNKYEIYDLDEYIKKNENINNIFDYVKTNSIKDFRKIEYNNLKHIINKQKKYQIIFLGGGCLTNNDVFDLIDKYILVYLKVDKNKLYKRVELKQKEQRPLFNDKLSYEKIYEKRINKYNHICDYKITNINELYNMLGEEYENNGN